MWGAQLAHKHLQSNRVGRLPALCRRRAGVRVGALLALTRHMTQCVLARVWASDAGVFMWRHPFSSVWMHCPSHMS